MSIDLQGWYIQTSRNINYLTAKYGLPIIGANHSWNSPNDPNCWSADKTHTFMEQVESVIKNYGDRPELQDVITNFRREAKELQELSIKLGKPIKSEWW